MEEILSPLNHTCLHINKVREIAPKLNEKCKADCDGWYRIDINEYARQTFADAGDCFYANYIYYKVLRMTDKSAKLYVVKMDTGLTHAFIVSGKCMYDKSQGRDIKQLLSLYQEYNTIVGYSICKNYYNMKDWLKVCVKVQGGNTDYTGRI